MNSLRRTVDRTLQYDDEDKLLSADGITYKYDLDGFLTTKTNVADITNYDYSTRGELLSVTLPDGSLIEYVHDPLGRRIVKKVNGTVTEKYLWQGMTRLLAVYDGADNLLQRFEYADGRMPVAITQGGATYYLTYDQVGSLRVVADASGNVVKKVEYDSFGNIIGDTNPAFEMPFGFAGGLHDRDTSLVRFGYRDYDPDVGRWTAKDPILFAGGDTDLYGYCLYDPVNLVDNDGLLSVTLAWHGFGGIPFVAGIGGTLTFGSKDGVSFFNLTAGVGVGSGVFLDLIGGPPKRSDLSDSPCDSSSGYVGFGLDASIGAGYGPVGVMTGANWAAGIGGKSENGDVTGIGPNGEPGYSEWNLTPPKFGFGYGLGASTTLGVNVGASWK